MADNIEEWVREGEIQETAREKHELMEQGPNTLEACVQAGPHNPARLPYQQSSSLTVFNFSLPPILSFPPLLMVQGQGSVQPLRAWCLCCWKHFSNVLWHFNHRESKYTSWFDNVSSPCNPLPPPHDNRSPPDQDTSCPEPMLQDPDDLAMPPQQQCSNHNKFPGTGTTYGHLTSFMERFDANKYSHL